MLIRPVPKSSSYLAKTCPWLRPIEPFTVGVSSSSPVLRPSDFGMDRNGGLVITCLKNHEIIPLHPSSFLSFPDLHLCPETAAKRNGLAPMARTQPRWFCP